MIFEECWHYTLTVTPQNLIRRVLSICNNLKNCHTKRVGPLRGGDLWARHLKKPPYKRGIFGAGAQVALFFISFGAKNVCRQAWLEFSITKKLCPGIIAHEPYFLERCSLCFLTSIAPPYSPRRHVGPLGYGSSPFTNTLKACSNQSSVDLGCACVTHHVYSRDKVWTMQLDKTLQFFVLNMWSIFWNCLRQYHRHAAIWLHRQADT